MGGGAVPAPATTSSNHHSRLLLSPNVSPFSSNFYTETSNFGDGSGIRATGYPNEINFGPVPSQFEVQNAISDLRRVMKGFLATNSELMMKSLGQKRLLDAYNLLQTDSSVQKLVLSISSDTEVWDAILKNDAVRDLQRSLPNTDNVEKKRSYKQELNSSSLLIKWIFSFMKLKITELIEKLEVIVFETIHSMSKKTKSTSKMDDILEEKVRSSLLLSVVILLIVMVTRSTET
ncbi:hypothetical protein LXL04_022766 [Taraxacum kok-saghyz]